MNSANDPTRDDLFEAYLDGELGEPERAELAEDLLADDQRLGQVELQKRIDRSLTKLFPVAVADEAHAAEVATAVSRVENVPDRRRWWWAAAAAVAGIAAAASLFEASLDPRVGPVPYFQRQPLAEVFQSTVRNGFEPYYECEEPARFAEVFAKRLGQPLELLPMPPGSRMLGLSYPGGLSRDTTAMLCEMDGAPVMVFVDRLEADHEIALAVAAEDAQTNVFRETRDGLVYYEVSRFDSPRALQFLRIAEVPDRSF